MTTTSIHVAAQIRAELARRRMTRTQLAEALDWSPAALHRRLSGVVPINVDELATIARYLEMSVADFMPPNILSVGTKGLAQ